MSASPPSAPILRPAKRASARRAGTLVGLCVVAGVLVAGMTFPLAAAFGAASNQASDTVATASSDLADLSMPAVTTVTDSVGTPIAYLFDQYRVPVSTDQVSSAMKAAVIAIEDRRFYDHAGVDWQGTLRALVANSASGDVVQGASTLTQQYVKNFQLYVAAQNEADRLEATEQTIARKLREVRIALQLERKLSKDQILANYLNIVFFGNQAFGVAAAARTYFDTTPDKLTVPQAALLAGMVRSPTAYDPLDNPQAARDRRNVVISLMAEQGMITPAQAAGAAASPLGVVTPLRNPPNGCIGAAGNTGFFCKYVMEYLTRAGFTSGQLKRGGYTIQTSLDPNAQREMQAALEAEVPPRQPHVANVMAMVAPGKQKHLVVAMGSSRTFGLKADQLQTSYGLPYEPVNLGAGSIYKIFTAATALEKGLGINYSMVVPPSGYASPVYRDGAGRPIPVANAGSYPGRMTMTDALAQSPNTAFIKLMEYTGVAPVVDMAVRLGLRSLATTPFIDPRTGKRTDRSIAEVTKRQQLASFTLGVTPTSVLELANVGATLASEGVWCPPSPIVRITDRAGNPVPFNEQPCEQVVEPGLANSMLTGLSKDDTEGTAAAAAEAVDWRRPMAGKTGTTQQHKSAGFVGVVPQVAGAVITFDNSRSPRPLCDSGGDRPPFACASGNIFGGKTPARTWFSAMQGYLNGAGAPVEPLPPVDPRYVEGGEAARIPDTVGRGIEAARAILVGDGWEIETREVDNRAPQGSVVGQTPRGTALPGEVVTLLVSSGEVPPPPPPPGEPQASGTPQTPVTPQTTAPETSTPETRAPSTPETTDTSAPGRSSPIRPRSPDGG